MNINLTLLFQVLFFIVFVWFSKRFVWTPLIGALNQRKTTIADGLAAAEKGRAAESQGKQRADETVAEATAQAKEIIARAEKRGAELVDEAKESARAEGQRIVTAARAEVDTELNRAKESLRGKVGELAVAGARQILGREIDADAHDSMLKDLAGKL